MSDQDDHLSHHNVLRGQASLFTVMFLSGMLVRSSYCHVISSDQSEERDHPAKISVAGNFPSFGRLCLQP